MRGLAFGVWGLGFRVEGLGFRVSGAGFSVQGLGFRSRALFGLLRLRVFASGALHSAGRPLSLCRPGLKRLQSTTHRGSWVKTLNLKTLNPES